MEYADIVSWIAEQAKKIPYGEISVKIIRHNGRDKLVEKNVSIKEKPEEER